MTDSFDKKGHLKSLQFHKDSKKVVLYNPNPLSENRKGKQLPLALLSISKLLVANQYEVIIVNNNDVDPSSKILNTIQNAICLGISSMTGYQITDGLKITKQVKKKYPDIPIIWGGWHPSMEPIQTLKNPFVDIVVRGQGERTFYEVIKHLEEGTSLHSILGISYKENGKIIHNPSRPVENLNNFPSTPFHLVDVENSMFTTEYATKTINYVSSIGCPFRCNFCEEQVVYKRKWVGLDPERMVDEIDYLVRRHGVNGIAFHDSNFFVDKRRVELFCKEIIKRGLNKKMKWGNANGRAKQLFNYEDKLWELMYESGLRLILIGAESGDQQTLDFIMKDQIVQDTISYAEKSTKFGIKTIFSFFIGLPWDEDVSKTTELINKEFNATLKLIERLAPLSRKGLARIILSNYTPYPGSLMYEKSLKIGFTPPNDLEGWSKYLLEKQTTFWIPEQIGSMIEFLTTYIFVFLDVTHYKWLKPRITNPIIRFLFSIFYKIFDKIVIFRWKHKFFRLRIDFKIYRYIKNNLFKMMAYG